MAANPVSELFDIPKFYYFQSKNVFTGSKGQTFNFKIIPGEQLTLQLWHGWLCSDKAEIEQEHTFPMEQEGFLEMIRFLEQCWLNEQKKPE